MMNSKINYLYYEYYSSFVMISNVPYFSPSLIVRYLNIISARMSKPLSDNHSLGVSEKGRVYMIPYSCMAMSYVANSSITIYL